MTEFEKMGGTYHDENGYLIPDLIVPESPQVGKWGRMYLRHLMRTNRTLYTTLLFSDKLKDHVEEIDQMANEMLDRLIAQMAAQDGITEQLKAENQMEWIKRMNSIQSQAEEIIWAELIV